MLTTAVLLSIGVCALVYCVRVVAEEVIWSRRDKALHKRLLEIAARKERAKGTQEPLKDNVTKVILAHIAAGYWVSDLDVPELVEQTGAPIEVVFGALDEIAANWGKRR